MSNAATASIIDRIKKLRALATSDNLHEAATAARLAEKLIQEHSLASADFAETAEDEFVTVEDCITWKVKTIPWQNTLGQGIARQYSCSPISCFNAFGRKVLRVYGRTQDIELFRFQYAFYAAEITRLCNRQAKGMGRGYRAAFCMGATAEILRVLREAQVEVRAASTGSALVRVDTHMASARAAMILANPKVGKVRARRVDARAYAAGQAAGGTIRRGGVLGNGGVRMLSA